MKSQGRVKEGGGKESQRDGIMGKIQPYVSYFQDGGRGHKPNNAGGLYKLAKARNEILP